MHRDKTLEILTTVAEYRILTSPQMAALSSMSKQSARKKLLGLVKNGLLLSATRGFGRNKGRPENVYTLSGVGVEELKKASLLNKAILNTKVSFENTRCLDHQLLLNWFRIHLRQIEYLYPQLSVNFFSSTSPFFNNEKEDESLIRESISSGTSSTPIMFTPDGVFVIRDNNRKKSLLFFLEVDMGTESISSVTRNGNDIRQKIVNYQTYFKSNSYKRYEQILQTELKGFRLLFLTNSPSRMANLCRKK